MITEFIIDETIINVGSDYIWLWDAMEPKSREILAILQKYPLKKHAHNREIHFGLGEDTWPI